MALRDYICCGECGDKIVYDGDDNGRDRMEQVWGEKDAKYWTVKILCPECITKLRAELAEARAEIEVEEKRFNQLSDDYAEATKAAEFNFAQYQDVSRMLCEVQDELAEVRTCLKWSYQNLYSMADPAMVKRVEAAMRTTEESSVDGETK